MSDGDACTGGPGASQDEALEYAAATRRVLARRGRRLAEAIRAEALAAAHDLEGAAVAGDLAREGAARGRLDALWKAHLAGVGRKSAAREILESALLALALALLLRAFVVEAFRIPSASMVPSLLVGDHILVSKLSYGVHLPFANRWLVRWSSPQRGDVIVFASPHEEGRDYIKRVVGVPGDVVEVRGGVVFVNGVPQARVASGEIAYDEQSEATGEWHTETCRAWREALARGPVGRVGPAAPADAEPHLDEPAAFQAALAAGASAHPILQCRRPSPGEREGPFERVAPGHLFVLGDNRDRSADSRSEGGWQVPFGHVKGRARLVWWSRGKDGRSGWRSMAGLRVDRLFKRIE